ncbi:MAG: metalloregulator ArsR/SmtB family transcription factor [Chloroflexi bacterium]|nr:metalloregulator ArsR/SmtB family transcription factor [Chloroflexota bacterium]
MQERRTAGVAARTAPDPYAGLATVLVSPGYDLIVSLRALYNPRTYETTRPWAAATKAALAPDLYERGRFFFQGFDTAMGYSALRLAPDLPDGAPPEALIAAVRAADTAALALYMLDTGEASAETIAAFRRTLHGEAGGRELDAILHRLPPEWARRCRRVLADPAAVQEELARLLEHYHTDAFAAETRHLTEPLAQARKTAEDMLAVLPTVEAIERLTGGYTLGDDLRVRRIVLAPSVFIYPFMSSRVDEVAGEALIVYGVRTNVFLKYEKVPLDQNLTRALKALADPARLRVLRLLSRGPIEGPALVTALGLTQPTVHHHLAQLRTAGLIRQERTKGGMRYTVRREAALDTISALERLITGDD